MKHPPSHDDSFPRKDITANIIQGAALGATMGLLASVAAAAVVYSTGYRPYENLRKALHDGIFDMGFDMAAGGLFGGAMQYWQAKQWNEAAEQHKPVLRSRS